MMKHLRIAEGKVVPAGADDGQVIVVAAPEDTERRYLIDTLKLDEHTLSSALDPDELGRLEFEPEHTAMIFKRPKNYCSEDNYLFKVVATGLYLFKDRLVIVIPEDAPLFEGRPFQRVQSLPELLLKIVYRAIIHYEEHLRVINAISGQLEQEISTAMENRDLLNLFALEKSLVYYVNAIHSNGVVIEKMRNNAAKIGFTPENMEFLDDIVIENNQCLQQADIYSNILASLMDARVSIVSNNLNLLMKSLTLVMIGIMLPTLVVSLFSMNVQFPMKDHPMMFWIILCLAGSSAVVVGMVWKYKRW